jgi:hypothetical protein
MTEITGILALEGSDVALRGPRPPQTALRILSPQSVEPRPTLWL